MHLPLLYALSWPERLPRPWRRQDWHGAPDLELVLQVDGWARQKVRELQGQAFGTG